LIEQPAAPGRYEALECQLVDRYIRIASSSDAVYIRISIPCVLLLFTPSAGRLL